MSEDDTIVQSIAGNTSDDVKAMIHKITQYTWYPKGGVTRLTFGEGIMRRMKVTEVSVVKKPGEPLKSEGRVVLELTVVDDMLNESGSVHGGCSAFLIDMCSTMSLVALSLTETGDNPISVSLSLDITYHSPAGLGDKLRIVSTSLSSGARALSARCEIWNVTHHRLVSSGVHIKMMPSAPKANL